MIRQRWAEQPPAELRADRVLLYRAGTKLDNWQHGFQYLDKFDVVLVREGAHHDEAVTWFWHENLPTSRIPRWRIDLMWMKQAKPTEHLLGSWHAWHASGLGWEFAFLMALYWNQPLIWMLPDWQQWQEEHEAYKGYDLYACRDENDWRATVWQNGTQLWMGPQNTSTEAAMALAEAKAWVDEGGARNGAAG